MSDQIDLSERAGGVAFEKLTRELVVACRNGCSLQGLLARTQQLTRLDPLQSADLACRVLARALCQIRRQHVAQA